MQLNEKKSGGCGIRANSSYFRTGISIHRSECTTVDASAFLSRGTREEVAAIPANRAYHEGRRSRQQARYNTVRMDISGVDADVVYGFPATKRRRCIYSLWLFFNDTHLYSFLLSYSFLCRLICSAALGHIGWGCFC